MIVIFIVPILLWLSQCVFAAVTQTGTACVVTPLNTGTSADDSTQIMDAYKRCGNGGSIEFTAGTFYIGKVMDWSNLKNVDIKILGKWVWSTNIQ